MAAYVFVFTVFQHYNGELPASPWRSMMEVLSGTAVAAAVFFVFTLFLMLSINHLK
ncbi:MAG: hypothetical protein ABIS29_04045 [Vicinamibacterales bacterium]